jgi:hypothetical protein
MHVHKDWKSRMNLHNSSGGAFTVNLASR